MAKSSACNIAFLPRPALSLKPTTPPASQRLNQVYIEISETRKFYEDHRLGRFPFIKLKINAESGFDTLRYVSSFCQQPLLLDPNEAFHDVETCIRFLEKCKKFPVEFVEQPMPATMKDEIIYLKKYSAFPLFADESVHHEADFSVIKNMAHGVNIKLMKAGGYLNGIHLLKEARRHGLKTMIGCMVETTSAIRSGMYLSPLCDYNDLDSFLLIKNEPFGLVEEKDGQLTLQEKE